MITLFASGTFARRDSGNSRRSRPQHFCRSVCAMVALLAVGCTHAPMPRIDGAPSTPPSASEPWRVPRHAVPPEPTHPAVSTIPSDLAPRGDSLTLGDVVDIALRNNPQTELSWAQARSAAASTVRPRRRDFPIVDASTNASYSQTSDRPDARRHGHTQGDHARGDALVSAVRLRRSQRHHRRGARGSRRARPDPQRDAPERRAPGGGGVLPRSRPIAGSSRRRGRVSPRRTRTWSRRSSAIAPAWRRSPTCCRRRRVRAQAQLDLETAVGQRRDLARRPRCGDGAARRTRASSSRRRERLDPRRARAEDVDTLINRALENRPDLAAARVQISAGAGGGACRALRRAARAHARLDVDAPVLQPAQRDGQQLRLNARPDHPDLQPRAALQRDGGAGAGGCHVGARRAAAHPGGAAGVHVVLRAPDGDAARAHAPTCCSPAPRDPRRSPARATAPASARFSISSRRRRRSPTRARSRRRRAGCGRPRSPSSRTTSACSARAANPDSTLARLHRGPPMNRHSMSSTVVPTSLALRAVLRGAYRSHRPRRAAPRSSSSANRPAVPVVVTRGAEDGRAVHDRRRMAS